jgi:hypothetical protein
VKCVSDARMVTINIAPYIDLSNVLDAEHLTQEKRTLWIISRWPLRVNAMVDRLN